MCQPAPYQECVRERQVVDARGATAARDEHMGQELLDGVRHRMAGGQSDATLKRTNKLLFTILYSDSAHNRLEILACPAGTIVYRSE